MDRYVLQVIPWDTRRFPFDQNVPKFWEISWNSGLQMEQHCPQFPKKRTTSRDKTKPRFLTNPNQGLSPKSEVPYAFKSGISGIFDWMVWISKLFTIFGVFKNFPRSFYHLVPFEMETPPMLCLYTSVMSTKISVGPVSKLRECLVKWKTPPMLCLYTSVMSTEKSDNCFS